MAHIAILTPSDARHLYPLGNLGAELVRRGHRVTIVAHERGNSSGRITQPATVSAGCSGDIRTIDRSC